MSNTKKKARFWIRELYKQGKEKGEFHTHAKEAALLDQEYFFKMFGMTPSKLQKLLDWIS